MKKNFSPVFGAPGANGSTEFSYRSFNNVLSMPRI